MAQVPTGVDDPEFRAWAKKTVAEALPQVKAIADEQMSGETVEQTMTRVALSLTVRAWRNTVVEDWHASNGPLSDGDMLRINSHTTWAIRHRLLGWCRELDIDLDMPSAVLNEVDPEDVEDVAVRIYRWLTRADRKLANGRLLREIAGDELEEFAHVADRVLSGLVRAAEDDGVGHAFAMAALLGGSYSDRWWGTEHWPLMVDVFMSALDDEQHRHWGSDGQFRPTTPEPAGMRDRAALRTVLLDSPWKLDDDSAQWITDACIGMTSLDGE